MLNGGGATSNTERLRGDSAHHVEDQMRTTSDIISDSTVPSRPDANTALASGRDGTVKSLIISEVATSGNGMHSRGAVL